MQHGSGEKREIRSAIAGRTLPFREGASLKGIARIHADYAVTDKRDPVTILSETNQTRIPELLPIRYQRMAISPFTFLRGAAAVMAADLARTPQVGIPVQACGDCHLMNFGAFELRK